MASKKIKYTCIMLLVVLLGCSEKYETNLGEASIFATHSNSTRVVGQETEIRVFTDRGEEVTMDSNIFVNGEIIAENTFSANEEGFYEITAIYQSQTSPSIFVEYHDASVINYKKRILIEDYTGTWCGWCPRVSYAMNRVQDITDDVVFIAIHRAPVGTDDPYNYTGAESLEQLINTPGYPKGFINRINQWSFPEPFHINQVMEFTQGANPRLGLALSSSTDENKINFEVRVEFAKNFDNLKLVVQLLENGLVWPQVNYTDYYDGQNPIENYVHDFTLRQTVTDILGDDIPINKSQEGSLYERSFEIDIPEEVENISQLDLVAFIVDSEGEVINVRRAKVGEEQEFEFD